MTKQDNSKQRAGGAAALGSAPTPSPGPGSASSPGPLPAAAPAPESVRAGPRDGLVLLSIAIVSAAIAMMLMIQFGLPLPVSVVAGAAAWTVFMLIHKQVQKAAQISQLKAELARVRVQGGRPRTVARVAPLSSLDGPALSAGETRASDLGSLPSQPDFQPAGSSLDALRVGPQSSAPGAQRPRTSDPTASDPAASGPATSSPVTLGDIAAARGPRRQQRGTVAPSEDTPIQEFTAQDFTANDFPKTQSVISPSVDLNGTRLPEPAPANAPAPQPATGWAPSLVAFAPGETARNEQRSEMIRDHWSFRPRADTPAARHEAPASGAAGMPQPGRATTIEGDLELVQRKIKELADEVNATEALNPPKLQRFKNQARFNADALEDSIGALKAAATSMRDRPSIGDYIPTLDAPPTSSPAAPPAPQGFGELVIPATAERIAGSDAAGIGEARRADVAPPNLDLPLPGFRLGDIASAQGPASPSRTGAIARAVDESAMDVFLAPIVTLAAHTVSHYEMTVALKAADGSRIDTSEDDVARLGEELAARFDIERLIRAAALSLRMENRDKDGSLLVEFFGPSFTSRAFFQSLASAYETRPRLASQLVVTLSQRALDGFTPAAWQAVRDMHAFGFRFALGGMEHLGTDFAALAAAGFRFVRLDAPALIDGMTTRDRFVSAAEIYQRATLAGLAPIASGVVDAETQRRLLDAGVLLGQGPLFGAARHVSLDGAGPNRSAAA